MDVFFNVLLVILVIAVVVLAVLYFLGRKMENPSLGVSTIIF